MHIPVETTYTELERKAYARQTTHFQDSIGSTSRETKFV
jgi:hypothetical protein